MESFVTALPGSHNYNELSQGKLGKPLERVLAPPIVHGFIPPLFVTVDQSRSPEEPVILGFNDDFG